MHCNIPIPSHFGHLYFSLLLFPTYSLAAYVGRPASKPPVKTVYSRPAMSYISFKHHLMDLHPQSHTSHPLHFPPSLARFAFRHTVPGALDAGQLLPLISTTCPFTDKPIFGLAISKDSQPGQRFCLLSKPTLEVNLNRTLEGTERFETILKV